MHAYYLCALCVCVSFEPHLSGREKWNAKNFELFIFGCHLHRDLCIFSLRDEKRFDIFFLCIWIGWHHLKWASGCIGNWCVHQDQMIHLLTFIVCHEFDRTIWLHGRRHMIFYSSFFLSFRTQWRVYKYASSVTTMHFSCTQTNTF